MEVIPRGPAQAPGRLASVRDPQVAQKVHEPGWDVYQLSHPQSSRRRHRCAVWDRHRHPAHQRERGDERQHASPHDVVDAVRLPIDDQLEGVYGVLLVEELDERITTIVIIDDNPYDSRLIRRFLKNYRHYRVFEANTSKDGLDIVRQRQPDLVLLDLMMPEMDGFAVMDAIKSDPRTTHIPVVIVSAKTLMTEERRRLEGYAESVWQKGSFSAKDLVSHVVGLVEENAESLDRVKASGEDSATAAVVPEFGQQDRKRILIVDDYEPETRLIRRLLETRPNYQVFEAHSAQEALDLMTRTSPDLVLLDLMMPDVSGEKLLSMLEERKLGKQTPVMIITSKDDLDADTRARLASDVDTIWSKSLLDRSSFLAHIETLLAD